jgi:hypothetical protein
MSRHVYAKSALKTSFKPDDPPSTWFDSHVEQVKIVNETISIKELIAQLNFFFQEEEELKPPVMALK